MPHTTRPVRNQSRLSGRWRGQSWHSLLAPLLGALCLVGCRQQQAPPHSKTTVRVAISSTPSTLDPQRAISLVGRGLSHYLYEGLTRLNAAGEPTPALSDQWSSSEDLRTWTFHLRPSSWEDGSPVVAEDFVRSVEVALRSHPPMEGSSLLMLLAGAREVLDGQTALLGCRALSPESVELTWADPQPEAARLVAASAFAPRSEKGLQNGPFLMGAMEPGRPLLMVRNERFWNRPAVQLERLEWIPMEELAAMEAYERGDLDWYGGPLGDVAHPGLLIHRPDFWSQPIAGTVWIRCNTRKPPMDVASFRQQVAAALHPQEIAQILLDGQQTVATELVPPCLSLGGRTLPASPESPSPSLSVSLLITNQVQRTVLATLIQQQLKEAGIACRLVPCEPKIFFERMRSGEYELALSDWIADVLEPEDFLTPFASSTHPANRTGWSDPEISTALHQAKCTQGESRTLALQRAQEIILRGVPVIPLYHHAAMALVKPGLEGGWMTPLGDLDLTYAHWAPAAGSS